MVKNEPLHPLWKSTFSWQIPPSFYSNLGIKNPVIQFRNLAANFLFLFVTLMISYSLICQPGGGGGGGGEAQKRKNMLHGACNFWTPSAAAAPAAAKCCLGRLSFFWKWQTRKSVFYIPFFVLFASSCICIFVLLLSVTGNTYKRNVPIRPPPHLSTFISLKTSRHSFGAQVPNSGILVSYYQKSAIRGMFFCCLCMQDVQHAKRLYLESYVSCAAAAVAFSSR